VKEQSEIVNKDYTTSTDPETLRAAEKAKEAERIMAMQLGYNPFQPQISTNQAARSAQTELKAGPMQADANPQSAFPGQPQLLSGSISRTDISSNGSGSGTALDVTQLNFPSPDLELSAEELAAVDAALLALDTNDASMRTTCAQTLLKLLGNLLAHPSEEKYRCTALD
jgi:hypothetical protein